jgi:L-threonylcarbamoyladenylate synthase
VSQFLYDYTADAIGSAATDLMAGNLVAFPTETVYGLGADASNEDAVARIYQVKGRPSDHPLIVHIASMERMGDWATNAPEYAFALARDFWPGPMTLVLKRSNLARDFVTGGQDTIGVRVPNHFAALSLLEAFERVGGKGIAAPSANRYGHVSPTDALSVVEELGAYFRKNDKVLDGGVCGIGIESTIIDCTQNSPSILRPGPITSHMIEESTGHKVLTSNSLVDKIRVSGSSKSHYSPVAKVYLDQIPQEGQGFIALARISTPEGVIRLASPSNDSEFAHILYASLRKADLEGLKEVVIHQPNGEGIGLAICDRIARASHRDTL